MSGPMRAEPRVAMIHPAIPWLVTRLAEMPAVERVWKMLAIDPQSIRYRSFEWQSRGFICL